MAGWYTGGAVPGEIGAAVIIGHNDTRSVLLVFHRHKRIKDTRFGEAVFHDLKKIKEGADDLGTDKTGKALHFTVTAKKSVAKNAFPTEKVYGPTRERALRLITCDGDFDAQGHPVDNLIVYATAS